MNSIISFLKNKLVWLQIVVSAIIVVAAAAICVAISGPETAIASGLGVWLFPFFGVNVWVNVAYGWATARNGVYADIIGAVVGVLLCLLFV